MNSGDLQSGAQKWYVWVVIKQSRETYIRCTLHAACEKEGEILKILATN